MPPHSSSSPWIDKPDQIPGDGYHRGQAGCRKPAVQALLRPPHYSGQVDPANCSSAKVASKRTNCVTPGGGGGMGGDDGDAGKKKKNACRRYCCFPSGAEMKARVQQQAALGKTSDALRLG